MRSAFIQEIRRYARENANVVLVVGDLGYSVVEEFADEFPDRFFNSGVAEQNMAGLAAGMASEGCHVFTYSIANFSTFRCAEQIRNDIDYHNHAVTTVVVGGGVAYGSMGYSHHAVQDLALMRLFPNHVLAVPGDPLEVRGCMNFLRSKPQPSYLRLGRSNDPTYHATIPKLEPGSWLFCAGNPLASRVFLTTGGGLGIARKLLDTHEEFCEWAVFSLPIWGMRFKGKQSEHVRSVEEVITVEDHFQDGGFGSWFREAVFADGITNLKIRNMFLDYSLCEAVGSQEYLHENYLKMV